MRVFTEEAVSRALGIDDLATWVENRDWRYPDPWTCYIHKSGSVRVALCQALGEFMTERSGVLLWVTEYGVWNEHRDLFEKYRLAHGESRPLHEARVHLVEQEEADALTSLLLCGVLFGWDMHAVSTDRSVAVTFGHDEWMGWRCTEGFEREAEQLGALLQQFAPAP